MQNKWKRAGQRVSAAKRWLTKAEEAFSQESPVRGELNLLLAEAELKRLKESEPSAQRRWMRHGAALAFALVLGSAAIGAWWSLRTPVESVTATPGRVALKAEPPVWRQPVAAAVSSLQHEPIAEARMPAARLEKNETVDVKQPEKAPTKEPIGVTGDELRQLVRKAGQTLRGQQ